MVVNEIVVTNKKLRKIFVMCYYLLCITSTSYYCCFRSYHVHTAGLGSTNIWPTMFGGCTWQVYVMVPGLFATNDTVWICPLRSVKVSIPSTSMTW
jgi:hypothetical protein